MSSPSMAGAGPDWLFLPMPLPRPCTISHIRRIAAGSTVITDGWRSYPTALDQYAHEPINISATHRPAHESLPAVHRLFALVKRSLEGTYQGAGSVEHLPEYLDEFVFRFNRRRSRHRGLVFYRLLQRAVASQPIAYHDLVRVPLPKKTPAPGVTGSRSQPRSLELGTSTRPWRQRH